MALLVWPAAVNDLCRRLYQRAGAWWSPYRGAMPLEGEYEPTPSQWVRDQVEAYERSGGREANTLRDTGLPIIVVTTRGHKSGKIRKFALMRVEHDGEYALVASMGGAPTNPVWYNNVVAHPDSTTNG